ncbi:TPA: hypothetical protein DCR49_10185 [Candidatus Delongbacteria bacterium]|nr:hypothetical protein [Candidatus Delongbacteria bacterium]
MGFITKKREIDLVSIISISAVSVILTFFAAWLYYGNQVDKMKSSYEIKVSLIKDSMENIRNKNRELEAELEKLKAPVVAIEDSVKAAE